MLSYYDRLVLDTKATMTKHIVRWEKERVRQGHVGAEESAVDLIHLRKTLDADLQDHNKLIQLIILGLSVDKLPKEELTKLVAKAYQETKEETNDQKQTDPTR